MIANTADLDSSLTHTRLYVLNSIHDSRNNFPNFLGNLEKTFSKFSGNLGKFGWKDHYDTAEKRKTSWFKDIVVATSIFVIKRQAREATLLEAPRQCSFPSKELHEAISLDLQLRFDACRREAHLVSRPFVYMSKMTHTCKTSTFARPSFSSHCRCLGNEESRQHSS